MIGDWVWGYHEGTGEYGLFPVTDVIVHTDPAQVHLLLDGELLETTPEHPFYTLERGWVDAGDLWVGAHIRKADGSYGRVQFLVVEREPQVMYNLTVAEAHTFFVEAQHWLVHNSGCRQLIVEEGPDRYLIYDENFPNEFYPEGKLRNGVLHLNFATRTGTNMRNPGLRGQEQFEKIVNKFKGRIQAIRGG